MLAGIAAIWLGYLPFPEPQTAALEALLADILARTMRSRPSGWWAKPNGSYATRTKSFSSIVATPCSVTLSPR